jgi:hypothetical protein
MTLHNISSNWLFNIPYIHTMYKASVADGILKPLS